MLEELIVLLNFSQYLLKCPEIDQNDSKFFQSEIGTPWIKFLESPLFTVCSSSRRIAVDLWHFSNMIKWVQRYNMILWVLQWWLHDWRGKIGAIGGRDNMYSRVHRFGEFIPFHHALKWLFSYNIFLVFSQIWVMLHSMRITFSIISFLTFIRRAFNIINMSSMRKGF